MPSSDSSVSDSVLSERPGRVRERLIAALIPDTVGFAEARRRWRCRRCGGLSRPGRRRCWFATARMDGSGRVGERRLLRALGWQPRQRLDMDTMHGMIVIATTPNGTYVVDPRGAIKLPAAVRH
jgi:hypothetical protein